MELADCDVEDDSVIYKGTLIYLDFSGSGTGWKGVSKGKGGRFYARITGLKNHGHVSVPGTYETPAEAAAERAFFKRKLERKEIAMPVPKPGRVQRGTGTPRPCTCMTASHTHRTNHGPRVFDRNHRKAEARPKAS